MPKEGRRQEPDETCLVLLKQSCFFEKKEEKNLRCTVNAFSFFPLNLYTVDLTLRPCRKIGRAENRRYFRLSKQQLEIFVGNKETLVSFNVTRCRFIIDWHVHELLEFLFLHFSFFFILKNIWLYNFFFFFFSNFARVEIFCSVFSHIYNGWGNNCRIIVVTRYSSHDLIISCISRKIFTRERRIIW